VRKLILPNGQTYLEVGPEPRFNPAYGVTQYIGDPHRFARFRHDHPARTHYNKSGLSETGETVVINPVIDGIPNPRSKIVVKLAQRPAWIGAWIYSLGALMWGIITIPGRGYFDTNDGTSFAHTVLRHGGGLARVEKTIGTHAIIEYQDFNKTPDPTVNAWNHPDVVTVHGLVGHSAERDFWKRSPRDGHLEWPFVSNRPTAVPLNKLEFFPELPHLGQLHGEQVLVEAYGFSGPRVFGLIEDAWRLLEEMLIVDHIPGWPRAGSDADRRVYIKPWIETWGLAWCNWTRGKNPTAKGAK
jgi:hypothetical protein